MGVQLCLGKKVGFRLVCSSCDQVPDGLEQMSWRERQGVQQRDSGIISATSDVGPALRGAHSSLSRSYSALAAERRNRSNTTSTSPLKPRDTPEAPESPFHFVSAQNKLDSEPIGTASTSLPQRTYMRSTSLQASGSPPYVPAPRPARESRSPESHSRPSSLELDRSPSRWQRAGAAAADPSDNTLGLSPQASQQLREMVHPKFIEPEELVQLRAAWAKDPQKATWHQSAVERFQQSLHELSEGLDAWEQMEEQHAKAFSNMVTAAVCKSQRGK